jgi:osmoprotectant transport system permease protein
VLPGLLVAHLRLSLLAVLLGVAIAIPCGVFAAARPRLGRLVVGAASVIQTIPGLALLALMVPLLAAIGLRSVGPLPAAIGLVLYSLLPIVRNTVVALTTIDPAVREAALGVGMTERQQLWRVDLPLARPVIFAGIRTATVTTVGMATLSTPVGAPSLGNLIFGGLQTRNLASVLVGCVAAAALAIALDIVVGRVAARLDGPRGTSTGRHVRVNRGVRTTAAAIALGVLTLLFLGGSFGLPGFGSSSDETTSPIVIGAKPFTEQFILAEILAEHVRRRTGRTADLRTSLGSTVAYDGVRAGAIDVYVDYTGTLWTTILKRTTPPPSRRAAVAAIGRELVAADRVHVIAELGFENAYCLAMLSTRARALGVRDIGDLTAHAPTLSVGGDYEFFGRQEWRAIVDAYGLSMREQLTMDPSLLFAAIQSDQIDVVSAYTTDPRLESMGLTVLGDPRGAIPPYDAVVLASERFLSARPAEAAAIRELGGALDAATMRRLNLAVDRDGRSPKAVALEFLAALP